jgi:hypothetical protein
VPTDVSEEHVASIFRIEKISSTRNQSESRWQAELLWNVDWHSTDYTASYPRRWYSTSIGFEVLTAVNTSTAFWDITPCSPAEVLWRFRRIYCFHLQGRRGSKVTSKKGESCIQVTRQILWKFIVDDGGLVTRIRPVWSLVRTSCSDESLSMNLTLPCCIDKAISKKCGTRQKNGRGHSKRSSVWTRRNSKGRHALEPGEPKCPYTVI